MNSKKVILNAEWIVACKIIQSVLGLVVSMMTARYLGPSNYGIISYAASIVAFVTPVMQLGLNSILVQEIVDSKSGDGEILGTSLLLCLISAMACICGILTFTFIVNHGETITIVVCGLYSLLLIFQACEIVQYWFQAKLLSKYTSIVSLIAYVFVSIYKIYLLATAKNVYWFAVSNAFDYFIIAIGLLFLYQKLSRVKLKFSKSVAMRMLGKSRYYIVSSLMVMVFAQTDRIMLKLMVGDAATGYYSAAVACAGITGFVFSAIIDSARPAIFESRKCSQVSFENNMTRLYSVIIYLSFVQSIFITIFSGVIIDIIYGADYRPAVPALRLVVWYTTFSYMGSVRNIWILAEGKQKYLWIINLSGAVINVMLNALLIPCHGIIGAAFASLLTQFFTNFMIGYIIAPIRNNNRIIIHSLDIRFCKEVFKKVMREKNG